MKKAESTAGRLAVVVGRLNRRMLTAGPGLSQGLLSSLATVSKHGPMRLADLANTELVSAPSITRIVAELESRGLVTRTVDPDDGRAFLIAVTSAGNTLINEARSSRAGYVSGLLASLDDTDLAAIEHSLPALEKLI